MRSPAIPPLVLLLCVLPAFAADWASNSEILGIMDKSDLVYAVHSDPKARLDLRDWDSTAEALADPDWVVVTDSVGDRSLRRLEPKGCAVEESKAALRAYNARQYKDAVQGYARAWACDTTWLKAPTYLGNSWFGLGRMDSASRWFREALRRNPDDYQAHFFLADAHLVEGRTDSARFHLSEALLRNRNSPILKQMAERVAKAEGRVVDHGWPVFGVRSERTPRGAKLSIADMGHFALGACLAVWDVDPAMAPRRSKDDAIRQTRLRNCLANQAIFAMTRRDKGDTLDPASAKLVRVVDDGLLAEMVVWEVAARSAPGGIYLLPTEIKERMRRYVERFHFAP